MLAHQQQSVLPPAPPSTAVEERDQELKSILKGILEGGERRQKCGKPNHKGPECWAKAPMEVPGFKESSAIRWRREISCLAAAAACCWAVGARC